MAQTARSIADLELLLADNSTHLISPQDLRDLMESAMGCYGQLKIDSGSTAEGLSSTPSKIDTWLTTGPLRNATAVVASPDGHIELGSDGVWLLHFTASFLVTGGTDRFKFVLRADDVEISGGGCERSGANNNRASIAIALLYSASSGEQISVWGEAVGNVGDVTIEHARLAVHRVG